MNALLTLSNQIININSDLDEFVIGSPTLKAGAFSAFVRFLPIFAVREVLVGYPMEKHMSALRHLLC